LKYRKATESNSYHELQATFCLTVAISNATINRVFSLAMCVKTRLRNVLNGPSLRMRESDSSSQKQTRQCCKDCGYRHHERDPTVQQWYVQ